MNKQKQTTLEKRIFAEGETTEEQVYRRVAKFLADNAEEEEEFFRVMNNHLFLPNSPCLANAGVEGGSGQLNACFVLPVEDDLGGIFETIKNTAMIHKTGGGTGFNFSRLRAKGSPVGVHRGVASGVVSFMRIFDVATNEVKQGGVRRGANMAVLNIDHPDIEEFITCKTSQNAINNFNLSIGITDDFMIESSNPEIARKQHRLFDKIVEQAWLNGEPGILFLDRINDEHRKRTCIQEEIEATNPCGEMPLLPYENCCLGSLNLSALIDSDIDLDEILNDVIRIAMLMLNRILDKNVYPLPQNKEIAMKYRKVGLGVMGYADMLIKKVLIYGSKEAITFTDELARKIQGLARVWGNIFGNRTVTSIAPTGSLSILAGCSSGIEPLFAIVQHTSRLDETFETITPIVNEYYDGERDVNKIKLAQQNSLFVLANDLSVKAHIETQAIWQRHIDNAVSKTINLPNSATKEDVRNAILLAYRLGCKGITVYRDGSRDSQVISSAEKVRKENKGIAKTKKERQKKLKGETTKYKTGCGNLYVTVNHDDSEIQEVFTNTGRAGGCPAQSEAITRLVATSLRCGVSNEEIAKQLNSIRCMSCLANKTAEVKSCPNAIAKSIIDFKNKDEELAKEESKTDSSPIVVPFDSVDIKYYFTCPDCDLKQEMYGSCAKCINCGYQKCSG